MNANYFSANESIFFVVVVLISNTILLHRHTATSLVRASSSVEEEQASSSNFKKDKEIKFISFNGNLLDDSKPIQATENTVINDTIVSATRSETNMLVKRDKRYLAILERTRMSFRLNTRNNILPNTNLLAYGYGFRCNYLIQNNKDVRPFRRDTYETLGQLMDKSGFDGKACILKAFCTAHMKDNSGIGNGMLFKLLKYIFTLNDDDKRHFPYLKYENCHQIMHSHCPLSFDNISPFTDDV